MILFDGNDLSKWEADEVTGVPTKWVVKNGAMECVPGSGYIRTKENFGDCQLHVEWAAPSKVEGNDQGRGNSVPARLVCRSGNERLHSARTEDSGSDAALMSQGMRKASSLESEV
mgnify:CR=1 FL=1